MNMRILVMISFFSFVSANAMWNKFTNWYEDPTPHMAIAKIFTPKDKKIYSALLATSQQSFPHVTIEDGTPIVQVICFTAATKRSCSNLNKNEKLKKMYQLSDNITFYPLTVLKDFKEGSLEHIDDAYVICDQSAIHSIAFQEMVNKLALKKE